MIRVEQRASTVLYKFLMSNCKGYMFLIPANVCSVVPLTFLKAGVDFSFVDIDINTHAGSFDEYIRSVEIHKNEKIGVLFVNAYGYRNITEQFYIEIKSLNPTSVIIEDDCLCIPETHRKEPIENVDLELYSTGYSKFVQMPMEGGYGLIREGESYFGFDEMYKETDYSEQQTRLKNSRKTGSEFVYVDNSWLPSNSIISTDFTIDNYLSEIERLITVSSKHKQIVNAIYDSDIPDEIKMGKHFNMWRFNLLLPSSEMRDVVMDALDSEGLYASQHYKSAASLYKKVYCPNTEIESSRILNLFNEEKYTPQMAERTAAIISELYRNYDK